MLLVLELAIPTVARAPSHMSALQGPTTVTPTLGRGEASEPDLL